MRNLLPPEGLAIGHYDRIAAAKQLERRQRLQTLRARIAKRYKAYARAAPRLERLAPLVFSEEQREVLLHCYEVPTAPLDELIMHIKERQDPFWRSTCAYCGINSPRTTEHYLPRTQFPEYAVCADNLLPCCDECNNLKGTQWRDEDGRRVLHFYYDALPHQAQWLFATITLDKNHPVAHFEIQQPPGFDPGLYRLIQAHYQCLQLTRRYTESAHGLFSEAVATVASHPPGVVAQVLTTTAASLARYRGQNHWKVAAYFGMASSSECVTWLLQEARGQGRARSA